MKYALLIHQAEGLFEQLPRSEQEAIFVAHERVQDRARQAGHYVDAVRLSPTATAVSVRISGDKQVVIDGPFAETKEQLLGFYLVDCKNLDEAIAYAKQIPCGVLGTVEIRPVRDLRA